MAEEKIITFVFKNAQDEEVTRRQLTLSQFKRALEIIMEEVESSEQPLELPVFAGALGLWDANISGSMLRTEREDGVL